MTNKENFELGIAVAYIKNMYFLILLLTSLLCKHIIEITSKLGKEVQYE